MPEPTAHHPTAPGTPGPLPIEVLAARVGQYRWIEARLFELLGGWVQAVPELAVKRAIAEHAHHHAWHAELWEGRLPRLAHLDHDALTVASGRGAADLVAALAEGDAGSTVVRLVGVYRVLLPRVVAAYAAHLSRTSAVSDAPVARVLRLVLADEVEDWRAGEALLQSLIATPEEALVAGAASGRLEALLVADPGLLGADDPLRTTPALPRPGVGHRPS